MGIKAKGVEVDVEKMQTWKDGIVKKLTSGVSALVKGSGGAVVMGNARLTGLHTVLVEKADGKTESFVARKGIVIATGASPIELPGFKPDGEVVVTAREAVSLRKAPRALVLIGGGIIGMELGMVYQKLGTKVVAVELLPRLLTGIDEDLVQVVEKRFVAAGGEVLLGARAKSAAVKSGRAAVEVEIEGKTRVIECDKVLVAVGFKPNSQNLGLEEFGIKTDQRGHILVDAELRTSAAGVYAIGDVTGVPYLAHRAMKQGEIVAEVIAGRKSSSDWRAMPSAVFTDPEIATVGLSEAEAKQRGLAVKIGKFPFSASGRAMAVHETAGFIKTIVDADKGQVLGVGIVGPEASELIGEATLAIEMCAYAEDVALTIHTHPTLAEALNESFRHALKEAIHIVNK
jgi:dihydrolipoamide dehydrogenase